MDTPATAPAPDPASEGAYHYRVIARAIAEIDAAHGTPLPLETLAARLGLSPAHFQRVFSRWAGVSPKRYQQHLTLDRAKALLAGPATLAGTAEAVGLSGSGRLHDLFLRWEAMSPGAHARRGDGLTLREAVCDTPFGPAVAMATEHGICGLAFAADCGIEAARADLAARWPAARRVADPDGVTALVTRAIAGNGRLHVFGAPFQIKVWEALLDIPEGAVTTYAAIARHIGAPRATRAVGTAVGRNPVGWLIPCHRVLRKDGGLGGYHWGLGVKRAMLARESARSEEQR